MLADLRIGLSFDEPEVKEKLSKTLEHVALGDPERLAHHVSTLAEHLDDEDELVRYHLCTALMIVGCESPETLTEVSNALDARLDDENVYVRGRAVEALACSYARTPTRCFQTNSRSRMTTRNRSLPRELASPSLMTASAETSRSKLTSGSVPSRRSGKRLTNSDNC
jgi:hypothetical protein